MQPLCYDAALNDCTAVAPGRWTPLCEGVEDTMVLCQNLAVCVLSSTYVIERSVDRGHTWDFQGSLAPMEKSQFWRQSGELWRLRNTATGQIIGPLLTNQTAIRLVALN